MFAVAANVARTFAARAIDSGFPHTVLGLPPGFSVRALRRQFVAWQPFQDFGAHGFRRVVAWFDKCFRLVIVAAVLCTMRRFSEV